MKRRILYYIAVFLPLLVWSCGGKDNPDLIPPPPTPSGNEQGGGGSGGSGGDGGGGGGGTNPWDANRGQVVRPKAGNGWTVSTVREGIIYYAYSGKDAVTGVNQEAFAIDLDLSNPNYTVALTHTLPAAVTSDVYKDNKAIVAMNAGYEAGSIFIKIGGVTKSAIPNTQISDTGVANWKSEAAFFCDGVRNVSIAKAGDLIRPYKAPDAGPGDFPGRQQERYGRPFRPYLWREHHRLLGRCGDRERRGLRGRHLRL